MAVQTLTLQLFCILITHLIVQATRFNPTVEWTCQPSGIFIAVRTNQPFSGVAYPRAKHSSCSATGTGSNVTRLTISFSQGAEQCGLRYDKTAELYWVDIEVHEHKLLILEQDRVFNVSCEENALMLKMGDIDGMRIIGNDNDADNTTIETQIPQNSQLPEENQSSVEFELHLQRSGQNRGDKSAHDVAYGQSYDMKVSLLANDDSTAQNTRFRITRCIASTVDNEFVELIDENGCSVDQRLVTDFVYQNKLAISQIPSMFRFPSSSTMKLECWIALCQDYQVCTPNCNRKSNDPVAEVKDAELIAQLLGMENEAIRAAVTEPIQSVDYSSSKTASTVVHVLERRDIPMKNEPLKEADSSAPSTSSPECTYSNDVILLYKIVCALVIALAFVLLANVLCCIWSRQRSKKTITSVSKKIPPPSDTKEYWITGASSPVYDHQDFYSSDAAAAAASAAAYAPYSTIAARRPSAGSYASVKHRSVRQLSPPDPNATCFTPIHDPLSVNSFRPTHVAPSSPQKFSIDEQGSRQDSTFTQSISAGSTSGASTWHDSPGHVDSRESYSIL